eukprot:9592631-Ditylum_brightwellii.AAC.1
MVDDGRTFDITLKTLKEWSIIVNDDLNMRSICMTESIDDVCKVLDIIHILSQKPANADEKGNEEENSEAKTKEVSPLQDKPVPNALSLLVA